MQADRQKLRPGHEAYPTYHDANIQRVIANAVQWAAPRVNLVDHCPNVQPLENLSQKDVTFSKVGILQGQGDIQ